MGSAPIIISSTVDSAAMDRQHRPRMRGTRLGCSEQTGDTTIIKAPRATQGSLTLQNVNIIP
ncbi:MAG: hypothetical protein H8E10_03125 [Desulfobacterales bacterium]|nr:hypothetical protein [Desulfobacterales bacterium]MBL7172190.1 hypothetical protein [Desulfobacteraceae bacterium]